MAESSRQHRLRVLQHQARLAAEVNAISLGEPEQQLRMPLIVEVTNAMTKPRVARVRRRRRVKQPGLDQV